MHYTVGVLAVLTLLAGGCQSGCDNSLVKRELGKTEADYAAKYGAASKSPMTPDQAAFTVVPGGLLVTRGVDGKSVEELWLLNDEGKGLPDALAKRAHEIESAAAPNRTVPFASRGRPAAEIFEHADGGGVIMIERRNQLIMRVALCAQRSSCRLFEQMLKADLDTDALMAPAAESLRRAE